MLPLWASCSTSSFSATCSGDDLDNAYRSTDVFVLPSYREGFPLVVMEAMGYGLPIVTTPIRGCADHLAPGVHALYARAKGSRESGRATPRSYWTTTCSVANGSGEPGQGSGLRPRSGCAALCGDTAQRREGSVGARGARCAPGSRQAQVDEGPHD